MWKGYTQTFFYQICNITLINFVKPRNIAMRKQPFTKLFLLLFGLLAVMVAFAFYNRPHFVPVDTVDVDCPQNIEKIEGSGLLWESLSRQFVHASLFN